MVSYKNNYPGLRVIPNFSLVDQRISIADLHFTPKTNSTQALLRLAIGYSEVNGESSYVKNLYSFNLQQHHRFQNVSSQERSAHLLTITLFLALSKQKASL